MREIDTKDLTVRLMNHPLYEAIKDTAALQCFMRAHVFCVWDFQSLVTALQRALTCTTVPWLPPSNPEICRLINEIVLDEESDVTIDGRHLSHYELYREAMEECGADQKPIDDVVSSLKEGIPFDVALTRSNLPSGVEAFVHKTIDIAQSKDIYRIAAVFAYGREDVIPDMFRKFVQQLAASAPQKWAKLLYYLNRHVTHDGDRHGPMARAMMEELCGDEREKWDEAEQAAREALLSRIALWDAIFSDI